MKIPSLLVLILLCSCSRTIYVVRHAEKAVVPASADRMMASDPPLSTAGEQRAEALKSLLANNNIREIYSTPYKRTVATVTPLSNATGVAIVNYSPRPDSTNAMISRVLAGKKGNVVIAGHSNTVDDIVNGIAGKSVIGGDLPDSVYNALFILRVKGRNVKYERKNY